MNSGKKMLINLDTKNQLKGLIERIERLEQEKATISEHIRDIYAEAKGFGFDIKIIRQVIKIRKMDRQELEEQEELLDIYRQALDMLPAEEA